MKKHSVALIALGALVGCAPSSQEAVYNPPDELKADYEGRFRAEQLIAAQSCGASRDLMDEEIRAHGKPPASLSAHEAMAYRNGFDQWLQHNRASPRTSETCESLKRNPAIAMFFMRSSAVTASVAARNQPNEPSYCASGSVSQDIAVLKGVNDLDSLRTKCRVGDTVIIPAQLSGTIASACDFSKPVATANGQVFCTLGRIRPTRTE